LKLLRDACASFSPMSLGAIVIMSASDGLIIVVEDDPSMSVANVRLLRAMGLRSMAFASAEALLDSGHASTAACFVFDIQLPGLSGLELCLRLPGLGIVRPVIFITAFDHPGLAAEVRLTGGVTYFLKPFHGREFTWTVMSAMRES
jgi:FixJ family two-component response regulator